MRRSILVTGVTGSGKSTVCKELKRRGHKAYDIERIRPLFSMVHKKTKRVIPGWDNNDLALIKQMDWICNKERLEKLIHADRQGTAFYCGTASNLGEISPLFDKILLLRCSSRVLDERLRTRVTNDFARNPAVRRWVLASKEEWEDAVSKLGAVTINAGLTLTKTVDAVLKEARRKARAEGPTSIRLGGGDDVVKTATYFDNFSKEYESQDRHRYLFYRWMIESIVRQVDVEDCDVVDIGTGTGNLAVRLAMKHPGSRILGVDISKGMIDQAKAKCDKVGIMNVHFRIGTAENLRIAGKPNFVVSSLAFHHVKDKRRAVSNIHARLARGGKLVIGDWFEPDGQYQKGVIQLRLKEPDSAKKFDRSWEQALKGMSRRYGEEHPKEYPVSQTELAGIMKDAGFGRRRVLKSLLPNFAVVIGEK